MEVAWPLRSQLVSVHRLDKAVTEDGIVMHAIIEIAGPPMPGCHTSAYVELVVHTLPTQLFSACNACLVPVLPTVRSRPSPGVNRHPQYMQGPRVFSSCGAC